MHGRCKPAWIQAVHHEANRKVRRFLLNCENGIAAAAGSIVIYARIDFVDISSHNE